MNQPVVVTSVPRKTLRVWILLGVLVVLGTIAAGVWLSLPREFWVAGAAEIPEDMQVHASKEDGPGGGGGGGGSGGGGSGRPGGPSVPPGTPPVSGAPAPTP